MPPPGLQPHLPQPGDLKDPNFYGRKRSTWIERTRYARFATDEEFAATNDTYVNFPGVIPPIPPHLREIGERTSDQLVQREKVVYTGNVPGVTDWHWDFAFWVVQGGDDVQPARMSPNDTSPTALMTFDGVVTIAVFELNGGPLIDTYAWNIVAREIDQNGLPQHLPRSINAFHVATDASAARDVRANVLGLVDTENPQHFDEVVEANDVLEVKAGGFVTSQLQFSHWTTGRLEPLPAGRNLIMPWHTSGRAIAWYTRGGSDLSVPPPTPDPWWRRYVLIPPPPRPYWRGVQQKFDVAVTLASLADNLAPELQSGALDLATRQASIAAGLIKKGMIVPQGTTKTIGNGSGRKGKRG